MGCPLLTGAGSPFRQCFGLCLPPRRDGRDGREPGFIIASQADSYGVDQCLAKGEKCGAHAARSYCQSREFTQALSYRRVDPDEITGAVPKPVAGICSHAGCNQYVAIICQR